MEIGTDIEAVSEQEAKRRGTLPAFGLVMVERVAGIVPECLQ